MSKILDFLSDPFGFKRTQIKLIEMETLELKLRYDKLQIEKQWVKTLPDNIQDQAWKEVVFWDVMNQRTGVQPPSLKHIASMAKLLSNNGGSNE